MESNPDATGVVVRIDRDLTRAILRGSYCPGSRLPTLRDLAVQYGVNPSTMHRALARVEARGLITARQGSGLRVNDPHEVGDISLVPDWLAAMADNPVRAASILADILEIRRVLAVRLIARHRDELLVAFPELLAQAALAQNVAPERFWVTDIDFARQLLRITGNIMVLAVLNTVARSLDELPTLVEAMYGDPARSITSLLAVLEAIRAGGEIMADRIDALMAEVDATTVARFRNLLEAALGQSGVTAVR